MEIDPSVYWHPLRCRTRTDANTTPLYHAFYIIDDCNLSSQEINIAVRIPDKSLKRPDLSMIEQGLAMYLLEALSAMQSQSQDDEEKNYPESRSSKSSSVKELVNQYNSNIKHGNAYDESTSTKSTKDTAENSDNSMDNISAKKTYDTSQIPSKSNVSKFGSFVLTKNDAQRCYCYWRTNQSKIFVAVTPLPLICFTRQMLDAIATENVDEFPRIMTTLCEVPILPTPGVQYDFKFNDGDINLSFSELEQVLDEEVFAIALQILHPGILVAAWGAIILERKVLVTSCMTSVLEPCCEFLRKLALPLTISNYVPNLSEPFLQVVEAPFPYLYGTNSTLLAAHPEIDLGETIIIDLDKRSVRYPTTYNDQKLPPIIFNRVLKNINEVMLSGWNDLVSRSNHNSVNQSPFAKDNSAVVNLYNTKVLIEQGEKILTIFMAENLQFMCSRNCTISYFYRQPTLYKCSPKAQSRPSSSRKKSVYSNGLGYNEVDGVIGGYFHYKEQTGRKQVWLECNDSFLAVFRYADEFPIALIKFKEVKDVCPSSMDPEGHVFEIRTINEVRHLLEAHDPQVRHKWLDLIENRIKLLREGNEKMGDKAGGNDYNIHHNTDDTSENNNNNMTNNLASPTANGNTAGGPDSGGPDNAETFLLPLGNDDINYKGSRKRDALRNSILSLADKANSHIDTMVQGGKKDNNSDVLNSNMTGANMGQGEIPSGGNVEQRQQAEFQLEFLQTQMLSFLESSIEATSLESYFENLTYEDFIALQAKIATETDELLAHEDRPDIVTILQGLCDLSITKPSTDATSNGGKDDTRSTITTAASMMDVTREQVVEVVNSYRLCEMQLKECQVDERMNVYQALLLHYKSDSPPLKITYDLRSSDSTKSANSTKSDEKDWMEYMHQGMQGYKEAVEKGNPVVNATECRKNILQQLEQQIQQQQASICCIDTTTPSTSASDGDNVVTIYPVLFTLCGYLYDLAKEYDQALDCYGRGKLAHPKQITDCIFGYFERQVDGLSFSVIPFLQWAMKHGRHIGLQAYRLVIYCLHVHVQRRYLVSGNNTLDETMVLRLNTYGLFGATKWDTVLIQADGSSVRTGKHDTPDSVYTYVPNQDTPAPQELNRKYICKSSTTAADPCKLSIYLANRLYEIVVGHIESPELEGAREKILGGRNKIDILQADFRRVADRTSYETFLIEVSELQRVDLRRLRTPQEQCLFFVNVFNTLMLHGIIVRGSPGKTILERNEFSGICYRIGEHNNFSTYDIEYIILRNKSYKPSILNFKGGFSGTCHKCTIVEIASIMSAHLTLTLTLTSFLPSHSLYRPGPSE